METADKNRKKLWLPSWRGVIITLLVGSNIILIRIIGTLVYGQFLKQSCMNSSQTLADQPSDGEILMKIKKQLCVNTTGGLAGCTLCPDGWLQHNKSCYYFSTGRDHRTWNESRKECHRMGAHLLVIGDQEQQKFIYRSNRGAANDKFWIGLYRDGDGWRWVDGQIYNTDLFQLSGKSTRNCVLMDVQGVNHKDDCQFNHSWICQKRVLKI